jgi:hypothetical protein
LSLNPNKAVVISSTRKLFSEVMYLGVILDKGLTWKKQLDKVSDRTYKVFWKCRGTFGKTWGLKPKVVHWIYTVVVRTIVTYAALYGGLELKQARQNLASCKGWTTSELQEQ